MMALSSSINPHFIFNCLGSIQSYIIDNKVYEASDYIARFAKLIRMILNTANDKSIAIGQEQERLELYMKLEQLRCGKKMQYELSIGKAIQPEALIPNMIIQPLIENAIIHGIMKLPDSETGYIKVSIFKEEHFINITVEDNGIGYNPGVKAKHGYKSIGLSNIIQRINTIEGAYINIVNLKSVENRNGTRVIIKFPQIS